ncbi:helix-turn-helix transcriptional regulator [Vibrio tritonius]|uniref:helix-turn-helix transcriptional regulator n=1 Tax=Vibrio tritonius TaxID=1435069 RepID=UPI00315C6F56
MKTNVMTQSERLGDFLRLKRNSIAPETLGMIKPYRSRTPGLRREDVAELANISTVWYSKLERGKAERVSHTVISTIAKALQCDPSETRYLLQLSGHIDLAERELLTQSLSPELETMLAAVNPLPALLTNDFRDILRANDAFCQMVGFDVNALDIKQRNTVCLMTNNEQWREWLGAIDDDALMQCMQNSAALVRAAMASRVSDREWQTRLAELISSSELFAKVWESHTVRAKQEMVREYHHATLGRIELRQQYWSNCSGGAVGQLLVYIPTAPKCAQKMGISTPNRV